MLTVIKNTYAKTEYKRVCACMMLAQCTELTAVVQISVTWPT